MAKCLVCISDASTLTMSLDDQEVEFIQAHSEVFGLDYCDAISDIFEFGLLKMADTYVSEDPSKDVVPSCNDTQVAASVKYPTSGPLSLFSSSDKKFIMDMMNASIREVITMAMYHRFRKGSSNELGKEV